MNTNHSSVRGDVCDGIHPLDLNKIITGDFSHAPCDGTCNRPLSAAAQERSERLFAACDTLYEQADSIESAGQSTRRTTVLRAMSTMQPLMDRGDISSLAVHDVFRAAVSTAVGGDTCTACGKQPAQGTAWWAASTGDIICDTCTRCEEQPAQGTAWWAASTGDVFCDACRGRMLGYVLRSADTIRPEEVEWYYPGRVPLGSLTLLVGPAGLGKTTFACELAARGTRGELGGAAADVIFATTEDSLAHTLVPRFTAAGADRARVHFVQIVDADGFETGLTLPDDIARLQHAVEITGAKLIVLDPVVGHLSGGIDSHNDHSVRRALAPLAALAESTGAAILGIGHLNKSPSTDVLTRLVGSVAFGAAARSVLLFGEDPNAAEGAPERLLIHAKCNLGPRAVASRLKVEGRTITTEGEKIETSGIAWLGEDATATAARVLGGRQESSSLDVATDFLREVLTDGPLPSSEVKALATDEDITERTLKRAKKKLGIESQKKGFDAGSAVLWSLPTTPEFPILGQPL